MSSRQKQRLRKLEQQRNKNDGISSENEEEEEEIEESPKRVSAFARFNNSDTSSSDSDASSSDNDNEDLIEKSTAKDAKKDVKENASKKNSAKSNVASNSHQNNDDIAYLDAVINELGASGITTSSEQPHRHLLRIDNIKGLNPQNEVRKRIGNFDGKTRVKKNRRGRAHKAIFASVDENAAQVPSFASELGCARMNFIQEMDDGGKLFKFEASPSFLQFSQEFTFTQATYDPNAIVHFLQQHPFFVPALLQMSDIYLQMSQIEQSEQMLRGTLYILESWCSPRFLEAVLEGTARIYISPKIHSFVQMPNYDCGLDEVFVRALFRSMMFCRRRSCTTTAWNLGKMMLSLDLEADPMYIMLILDQLALAANQNEFVIEFYKSNNICQMLPNWKFSYALALCRMNCESEAKKAAIHALETFPECFLVLLEVIEKDAKAGVADPMVQSAIQVAKTLAQQQEVSQYLRKLYSLFASCNATLWRLSELNGHIPPYKWFAFQAACVEDPENASILSINNEAIQKYGTVRMSQFSDDTGAVAVEDNLQFHGNRGQIVEPNVNLDGGLVRLFFETLMPWARLPSNNGDEEDDEGE